MNELLQIAIRQAKQSFSNFEDMFTPNYIKGFFINQLDIELNDGEVSRLYHQAIQQLV